MNSKARMRYVRSVALEVTETHAQLFWSGGEQAVRLPGGMRLPGSQVSVRREGKTLVLEPLAEADDWRGFWDRLVPLDPPIRRREARSGQRRPRRWLIVAARLRTRVTRCVARMAGSWGGSSAALALSCVPWFATS